MRNSKIEWTGDTWNPVSGCTQVSPGCDNCYAKTLAERWGAPAYPNGFDLTFRPHKMDEPLRRTKPTVYFVNSMSDLFHAGISDEFIADVFSVMAQTPRHTYQILTKRPRRMREWCRKNYPEPLPNVWLGTSIEDAERMNRVVYLLDTPAAIRFVSFEPLLGVISPSGLRTVFTKGIHWAIVGGESGPKARTMEEVWAEHIVDAGKATKTPVFVKQMGDVWKRENKAKASKAGDPAEWPESLRVREFPTSEVAL